MATGAADVGADRLSVVTADLAGNPVPPTDLIWAGLNLFLVPEPGFSTLWAGIRAALRPGARFAGQLMGPHDSWALRPEFRSLTERAGLARLAGLIVEKFEVQHERGQSFGGPKHWHLFHIIARQPGDARST